MDYATPSVQATLIKSLGHFFAVPVLPTVRHATILQFALPVRLECKCLMEHVFVQVPTTSIMELATVATIFA